MNGSKKGMNGSEIQTNGSEIRRLVGHTLYKLSRISMDGMKKPISGREGVGPAESA